MAEMSRENAYRVARAEFRAKRLEASDLHKEGRKDEARKLAKQALDETRAKVKKLRDGR